MARAADPPVLLVKWYDFPKWLLERVESFPKSQRFLFGQRLADRSPRAARPMNTSSAEPGSGMARQRWELSYQTLSDRNAAVSLFQ